jgi:hypothetical protein
VNVADLRRLYPNGAFVVADVWASGPDLDSECVWTVSDDPKACGWETDSGCPGYGLTRDRATMLADAINVHLGLVTPEPSKERRH